MLNPRRLLFVLLICFIMLLTACVQDHEYYLYHKHIRDNTEVIKIELIYYDNQINLDNSTENILYHIETLETLNVDEYEDFLGELSEIGGLSNKLEQTIDSPNGTGVLIMNQDDGFTLITVSTVKNTDCIFVRHYDAYTSIEGYYGISWPEMIEDFKKLVNRYFTSQLN